MSVFNGPITSGVLGTVDKANVSASYFAPASGGGGGGGSGPNLVCSTLTTNSGDGTIGGVSDINPQSVNGNFGIGSSTVNQMIMWGDLAGNDAAYTVSATSTDNPDFQFFISTTNVSVPPISEVGTFLQIWSDDTPATGGILSLGAQPDGTGYVAVTNQVDSNRSTLFLVADTVKIFPQGDLVVSSINGALPGGALPEDAGFNNLQCSTIGVNTSLSIGGFTQPVITYGATTLNGSGTASVGLDRQYTDPYYPFVTYRGTLGANTSTLSVSTVNGDTFNIYGEANTQVQYMVVGN